MFRNDDDWTDLTDRFHAAAIGADTWDAALGALAVATNSRSGQLIGLGSDAAVPFNWMTNIDPATLAEWAAIGGADPTNNPRIRAGIAAAPLQVLAEADFITPDELHRTPVYADYYFRHDIPFIALTNLMKDRDLVIGLAVNRTRREGHADPATIRILKTIAPHVRVAVRTQMALEGQGAALLAGAMEALSIPAFVCDRAGAVRARSPQTEDLLGSDSPICLLAGRLVARRHADANRLATAIAAAARGPTPGQAPLDRLAFAAEDGGRPLVLDVTSLPRRAHGFSLDAPVLVVVRQKRRGEATRTALLGAVYGLTPAESDVATLMLAGRSVQEIALARGVSPHTVRAQVKSLYSKLGVGRFAEMSAMLGDLS